MKTKHIITALLATAIVVGVVHTSHPEIYPIVPGVVNETLTDINATICNPHWSTSSIRPSTSYTGPIKVKALATYNAKFHTNYKLSDGELDHVISIELLGSPTDPNNLDFEPYITKINGQYVGAHQKDVVENYLHKQVCQGKLTIQEAQKEIVGDWYKAYKNMPKVSGFGAIVSDPDDL